MYAYTLKQTVEYTNCKAKDIMFAVQQYICNHILYSFAMIPVCMF